VEIKIEDIVKRSGGRADDWKADVEKLEEFR
jgi:hypothetical protein